MNKDEIMLKVIEAYKKSNTKGFPIDCFNVLDNCHIEYVKYSEQGKRKHEDCLKISDEAFTLRGKIYYNDEVIRQRVRFSLIHELGHIMLQHTIERSPSEEQEANIFASYFLAPRMAVHYSKCKNAADVIKRFDLSEKAANIAYNDYCKWLYFVKKYGMSSTDKEVYNYFYNEEVKKFVWKAERCDYCYDNYAYNNDTLCPSCKLHELRKKCTVAVFRDSRESSLDVLRGNWLYGGL